VKPKHTREKKAYFFSIDAIVALIIMVSVLLVFSIYYQSRQPDVQHIYYSSDLAEILSTVKMGDVNITSAKSLLDQSNLTDYNLTVMEQIGRFWAVGDTDRARNLSAVVLGSLIPDYYGYAVVAENDLVYSNDKEFTSQLFSAKQMISGLEQGDVIFGQSARIFLTGINARSDTAYVYFGGYEGDGNISKIVFLPSDAYNIDEFYLEMNVGQDFQLFINGNFSGSFNKSNSTYQASKWQVNQQYLNLFVPGRNNVSILFNKSSSNFIGGGFLNVHYSTSEINSTDIEYGGNNTASSKYYFPGVSGIINIYSSFYVPGEVVGIEIYLHYFANHSNAFNSPLILKIGNETVFSDDSSITEQFVFLNSSALYELNLPEYSLKTIPLRFGFENLTSQEIVIGGYRGDSVLITDVSGSMAACDIDKSGYPQITCPGNPSDPEAERLETAKFVDKDFLARILNSSGNRVGLVSYDTTLASFRNLTDDKSELDNEVDSYDDLGSTCISCGIHKAIEILILDNTKAINERIWRYNSDYQFSSPPFNWTSSGFNDSLWPSGYAVLGFGGVDTTIFNGTHVDLWDKWPDSPAPVDFTSGLNSTANTFGLNNFNSVVVPLQNIHFDGPSSSSWTENGDVALVSAVGSTVSILFDSLESYYGSTTQINGNDINRTPGFWFVDDTGEEVFIFANDASYAAYSPTDVLVFRDMDSYGYAQRSADLSAYSIANLSYYWRLGPNGFDSNEYGNVRVSSNGGSSWNTVAFYDSNDDDHIYRKETINLSAYSTSNFMVRFGCKSSENDERCYYDDVSIQAFRDYLGMIDFFVVDSDVSLSGSLSQSFTIPSNNVNWAYLKFNHSINSEIFQGTASLYCRLAHPGGTSTVWSASYTTSSHPANGSIQENVLITPYLTSSAFAYNLTCGADVTSGSGRTIVGFDDITVLVNYSSSGDDGWDWARGSPAYGTWGNDGTSGDYDMASFYDPEGISGGLPTDGSGRIEIEIGGSECGSSCGWMDSGAFGIQFNITPMMYSSIVSGGSAIVSFDYEAFDRECILSSDDTEESVWIKARFGNNVGMSYLGYDLDTGQGSGLDSGEQPEDSTKEILYDWSSTDNNCWHANNYRGDFNRDNDNDYNGGRFSQDISSMITGPGYYHLDFGAKFDASGGWQSTTEGIIAYFDNVDLAIFDASGNFYFRNSFTIDDLNAIANPRLYVYSDDGADVYINGNLVSSDPGPHNATYWNVAGIPVGLGNLTEGKNTIAVKLMNDDAVSAKFDLELKANVSNIPKAMVIMSDGQANYCHGPFDGIIDKNNWQDNCADSQAVNETIEFACAAHNYYGIGIYTVAFGENADQATMNRTACCDDCSHFFTSSNVSGLADVYREIAENLIEIKVDEFNQTVNISGQYVMSYLFDDSYIEYRYVPEVQTFEFGSIPIKIESPIFGNMVTTGTVNVPEGLGVEEFKVTSYSGHRWTDRVALQNILYNYTPIFNLSDFNSDYRLLGDPYIVNVPAQMIQEGNNNFIISTGTSPNQSTNGSADDRAIYTLRLDAKVNYTGVYTKANGCIWHLKFEDSTESDVKVPANYSGTDTCDFESNFYNVNDAIDQAAFQLFTLLDYDGNKKLIVAIGPEDLETNIISMGGIPFMWGPVTMEVRVWS